MHRTIPNILTLLRLIAGFLLYLLIKAHWWEVSLVVIMIGIITDFYDGYFARKYALTSKLGAYLDPLADKVFILLAFLAAAQEGIFSWWALVVVALRDVFVTLLRTFLLHRGSVLHTSWFAKAKTTFQFGVLALINGVEVIKGARNVVTFSPSLIGGVVQVITVCMVIVTVLSAGSYIKALYKWLLYSPFSSQKDGYDS